MSTTRCRTRLGISEYASVVTSPAIITRPVVTSVSTATRLADGDLLTVGSHSLLVQTDALPETSQTGRFDQLVTRLELAVGPDHFSDLDFAFGDHRPAVVDQPIDYPALIGRLQAETAALVAVLLRRIEALDEEMALLREQMSHLLGSGPGSNPPAPIEKLRWDLIEQTSQAPDSRAA